MTAAAHAIKIDAPARQDIPARRDTWLAMKRGFMCRCPGCGEGKIYRAYLKVADACPVCGTELHHHRADGSPLAFADCASCKVYTTGEAVRDHEDVFFRKDGSAMGY